MYLSVICQFLLLSICSSASWNSEIATQYGLVRGTTGISRNGRVFHQYEGIPYAQPPVGELRFQPPRDPLPWTGVFNATTNVKECPYMVYDDVVGTEDCLILNIFVPHVKASGLSVLVWIHGGGFVFGSSARHYTGGPEFFMDEDIILVTFNYRLGVLGFLSTEDVFYPGNYGLLDQVAALRWIHENIEHFGGDPNSVTIFGNSAGGASVNYHMLSPLSNGLFSGAISMSGSALCPWASTKISAKRTLHLSSTLGCQTNTSSEIIECLKNIETKELIRESFKGEKFAGLPFVWVARVDRESSSPFLPEDPMKLLKLGRYNHVPFMTGYTRDEAICCIEPPLYSKILNEVKSDLMKVCVILTNLVEVEEDEATEKCTKVYQHYLQQFDDEDTLGGFNKAFSYGINISPAEVAVKIMQKFHPVYYYKFDYYNNNMSWFGAIRNISVNSKGVGHGTDLLYLFNYPNVSLQKSEDVRISKLMVSMFATFAKTKKGSFDDVDWQKVDSDEELNQLVINKQAFMKTIPCNEETLFWHEFYKSIWYNYTTEKPATDEL